MRKRRKIMTDEMESVSQVTPEERKKIRQELYRFIFGLEKKNLLNSELPDNQVIAEIRKKIEEMAK